MTSSDKYADEQVKKVKKYVKDIIDHKILSCDYVYKSIERYKRDLTRKDLYLDEEKVAIVFKFFSFMNINIDDVYKQFELLPYQAFIITNLYGFHWEKTDRRRFRYSYTELARKSGKTVFSAGKSLYHLVADGVTDPEVLYLASTKEQAGTALRYAKSIVNNSPIIHKKVIVRQYRLNCEREIDSGRSIGLLKTLASNAEKLDSYSPSYVLIDEYHAHPTDEIFKVMKSGTGSRKDPLIDIITTAGFELSRPCYKYRETSINVLRGEVVADNLFTMIFTLDEGDDYTDSSLWIKSNPALGHIIDLDYLKEEFNDAKITPSLLNNFLTKNLNLWVSNEQNWIEEKVLESSFKKEIDINDFKGQDCYIGLDLSSTRDLTSASLVFEKEGIFYAFTYFFMANNPAKKIRAGGINLGVWIRNKDIIECQMKTVDYDLLYDYFVGWSQEFTINAIGYDWMNSALLVPRLEALGIECIKVPQTASAFNFPLKYLEKLMYDEMIHLNNPTLRWNFRNVVLYFDGNGNIKIMKNKSLDSVDGCVALAQGISMWIQINLSEERLSYDNYLAVAK